MLRRERAELRDRDLEIRENLQEKGLEPVVGTIHLVHEQHRGPLAPRDRTQERTLEQIFAGKDGLLELRGIAAPVLRHPQPQHLAGVVPLVEGRVDVEPLVALEPDELRIQQARENLGELGLPDAGIPFDQERLAHLPGEKHRGRDGGIGDVAAALHRLLDRADLVLHPLAPDPAAVA